MRFQVPQFIEIEDKIVGSLTIKQFLYLAGGGGMSIIAYNFLNIFLAVLLIPAVVSLSLALAFYKYNNKPFIDMLESGFKFYTGDKLYIWKKKDRVPEHVEKEKTGQPQMYVPRLSDSKLKELTWSLDINENSNPLTGSMGEKTK